MKALLFTLSLLIFTSAEARYLKITQPEEFQFFHCYPKEAKDTDVVQHYVVDIREEQHKLYSDTNLKSTKAVNLAKLALLDDKILANSIEGFDVTWVSEKTELTFKMDVVDNGGYAIDGKLSDGKTETLMWCADISLE